MDWKRIAPWNWFKEEQATQPPPAPSSTTAPHFDAWTAWRTGFDLLREEARRDLLGPTTERATGPTPAMAFPIRPRVDISEGRKRYTVHAELPGIERDDVSITVDGSRLCIQAEKRQEHEEEQEGYHCVERSYGSLQRVLTLPEDADPESIDAKFKNGVLTLRIAKHVAPVDQGRKIEITAN